MKDSLEGEWMDRVICGLHSAQQRDFVNFHDLSFGFMRIKG